MPDKMNITAHVTGHRPKSHWGTYDETDPRIQKVKQALAHLVATLQAQDGYTRFITGMAIGVDTWFAEAVLQVKDYGRDIELIAAVPFEGQEQAWPSSTQKRYHSILDRCDDVQVIDEFVDHQLGPGYHPAKMQLRNEWMVDHSSLTIAVWNGNDGGTGNCVAYAKRRNNQLIVIDPEDATLVRQDTLPV